MTKEELSNLDKDKVLLVDIREDYELQDKPPLPEAIHIPMGEIIKKAEGGELPKDKKIITVCRSGGRCQIVNSTLKQLGYDVDLLEGGMLGLES